MTPLSPDDVSFDTAFAPEEAPRTRPRPRPQLTTSTMEAFSCLVERCPDTCCRDWAVPIDRADLEHMKTALSRTAEGRGRLVRLVVLGRPSSYTDAVAQLQMDERGACPMLEADQSCGVHGTLGEAALTTACSVFPRTALVVEDHVEVGGSLGCPEVARLTLLSPEPLHLRPASAPMLPRAYVGKTVASDAADAYAHHFVEVREALLECFRGPYALGTQLILAADLGARVQDLFHAGTAEFEGARRSFAERRLRTELASTRAEALVRALDRDLAGLRARGEVVAGRIWTLLSDRRSLAHGPRYGALLELVDATVGAEIPGASAADPMALWQVYERRRTAIDARLGDLSAAAFRNYCQHYLLRTPYTDSASLLEALYRLGVHLAAVRLLTVLHPQLEARLAAPPEPAADQAVFERIVVETVQTFTKAIGHHPDYLDAALHRGAALGGGFTFGQLVLLAKFVGGAPD
jgi:lysine-N-methylase